MTAIAATRRTVKELVDGTLRVTVDVEPINKAAFLLAFPEVDAPIALAPLNYGGNDSAKSQVLNEDEANAALTELTEELRQKGGPHSHDAGRICRDAEFQGMVAELGYDESEEGAAQYMRNECQIVSRAELDHNPEALQRFHKLMREFNEWTHGGRDDKDQR